MNWPNPPFSFPPINFFYEVVAYILLPFKILSKRLQNILNKVSLQILSSNQSTTPIKIAFQSLHSRSQTEHEMHIMLVNWHVSYIYNPIIQFVFSFSGHVSHETEKVAENFKGTNSLHCRNIMEFSFIVLFNSFHVLSRRVAKMGKHLKSHSCRCHFCLT